MIEIRKTEAYVKWIYGLRDVRARARILALVERLESGNPQDVKPVGEGASELRIDYGPGYRVYYTQRAQEIVILLAGGNKSTQARDIKTAFVPSAKPLGAYYGQNNYYSIRCRRAPSHCRGYGCLS